MEVYITPGAQKLIKKLPKIPQIAIIEKLQKIRLTGVINTVKLSGYKNVFRIRVGNYRVVYKVRDRIMYVFLVGHRKEVYKLLERLRIFE